MTRRSLKHEDTLEINANNYYNQEKYKTYVVPSLIWQVFIKHLPYQTEDRSPIIMSMMYLFNYKDHRMHAIKCTRHLKYKKV